MPSHNHRRSSPMGLESRMAKQPLNPEGGDSNEPLGPQSCGDPDRISEKRNGNRRGQLATRRG